MSMEENNNPSPTDYTFEKRQIIRAISSFEGFPMLNPRTMRVINLLQETSVNIPKLARILENNTTFRNHFVAISGVPDQGEESVKEAIRALGLLNVKHLVFSYLILPLYTIHDRDEWEHVYTTSILVTNLMKHFRIPDMSSLPLTALLHDIGVPLLRRFNAQRYDMIKAYARDTNQILEDVEEANLHITHAVASGVCIRKWGMPDDVFIVASYHHTHDDIEENQYYKELLLLQYADWVDHSVRNLPCRRPEQSKMAHFGLDVDDNYWLKYQTELLAGLAFKPRNEDPAVSGEMSILPGLFNEYIARLVAPIGYVERLRRDQERANRAAEEAEAKKIGKGGLDFNIGKFIKDKLQSKKATADEGRMPLANVRGSTVNPPRNAVNSDATQVFSRPKPTEPSFNLDQPKPLRLRSDGKVLETTTRTFKRPPLDGSKEEEK